MKRLVLLLLLIPAASHAQKIAEDKIDEFTHAHVKRTTWNWMDYRFGSDKMVHSRFSEIDGQLFLDVRYTTRKPCAMPEGSQFMLKFDDDSIITLVIPKTILACIGCGATGLNASGVYGLDLSFPIPADYVKIFASKRLDKYRIYLDTGYQEDNVAQSDAKTFLKQAALMTN